MSRPEPAWKKRERRVARMLGAERVIASGAAPYGKKGDVDLVGYVIDVKGGRSQIPKSVEHWLEAVRELAKKKDELPLLVLQPYRAKERLVVLTFSDFVRLRDVERRLAAEELREYDRKAALTYASTPVR